VDVERSCAAIRPDRASCVSVSWQAPPSASEATALVASAPKRRREIAERSGIVTLKILRLRGQREATF
jgi:hypothetical protein